MGINVRNPVFNAFGTIDCEVEHSEFGWIPYTASPDDCVEFGREVFRVASGMDVADYVAEDEPVTVPIYVSRFQARAALMDAGLLADAEIAVSSMGPLEQLAWSDATEWRRDSPTIDAMADLLSLTSEQVDQLFISASKIVA